MDYKLVEIFKKVLGFEKRLIVWGLSPLQKKDTSNGRRILIIIWLWVKMECSQLSLWDIYDRSSSEICTNHSSNIVTKRDMYYCITKNTVDITNVSITLGRHTLHSIPFLPPYFSRHLAYRNVNIITRYNLNVLHCHWSYYILVDISAKKICKSTRGKRLCLPESFGQHKVYFR